MSTGGEDDSRPSRPLISQRPTARDVPIAKYAEPSSAPRGLRGQSLLPGQGAPERIVPEDIGLAVLRDADTLDGTHVARAAARSLPELTSSPPPTPVSVEVPRIRSAPPSYEPYTTTPMTPSARSVQSGTLMSVGSVDPRAPTELSLPSPRVLSQSERAAYFGPEAVVDRTPVSALPSAPREPPSLAQSGADLAERAGPNSERMPQSSARSVPLGSGPPVSSARRSQKADSPAPPARHFNRGPSSYSPVSVSREPPHSPAGVSQSPSMNDGGPRFEIHSELDALPRELLEDNFDLRSASTEREPLASRKQMESRDGSTLHEPVSSRRDSSLPSERASNRYPSSSSAITILVDPGRQSIAPPHDPSIVPAPPQPASVPVSWVLGAALFALVLALLVAWVARAAAPRETARPTDEHGQGERSVALGTALPSMQAALASPAGTAASATTLPGAPAPAVVNVAPAPKPLPAALPGLRLPDIPPVAVSSTRPARAPPAHAPDLHPATVSSAEPGTKPRQSIY